MRRAVRLCLGGLALGLVASSGFGCVGVDDARYVYQDGLYGVVGIPSNTDTWPHHYRQQADDLMKSHFPDGYAIVRAEEVVEGSRTLVVDGKTSAEVGPTVPSTPIRVGTLGRTASRTQSDTLKIKECRIVYKKAGSPDPAPGFAAEPDLKPTCYIDPNREPQKAKEEAADKGKDDSVAREKDKPGKKVASKPAEEG
ncbi:MAG: hypothetical protein U0800_12940 [Isosphaeraceae bacterium]